MDSVTAISDGSEATLALPRDAFIPRRMKNSHERRKFAERRDELFRQCSPDEQRVLLALASWYETHREHLLTPPALLSAAATELFHVRYMGRPAGAFTRRIAVRGLAAIHTAIRGANTWVAQRSRARCVTVLRRLAAKGQEDVLLGAVDMLRALPLEVGEQRLEEPLAHITRECMAANGVAPARRMDAVLRCLDRAGRPPSHAVRGTDELRAGAWRLLLELAENDIAAAARVVDWQVARDGQSNGFSRLDRCEKPEQSFRLARLLRPHRPVFAMDLLVDAIGDANRFTPKTEAESEVALERLIDGSCGLLGEWLAPVEQYPAPLLFRALRTLFELGDPDSGAWSSLPTWAMHLDDRLQPADSERRTSLLAWVAFYGRTTAPQLAALALHRLEQVAKKALDDCTELATAGDLGLLWDPLADAIRCLSECLHLVEHPLARGRNRRVPACPDHPLVELVEGLVDTHVARILTSPQPTALSRLASVLSAVLQDRLFDRYHDAFQARFASLARLDPQDAGLALKRIAVSFGFGRHDRTDDRKQRCQSTFDLLLPDLEALSATAAKEARSGIGWSSRGNI
jgi:hypothetical protein